MDPRGFEDHGAGIVRNWRSRLGHGNTV
jgi:hypothetical protein